MEKEDREFADKQLLRKSIELNIVGEIVRLHNLGMDSKTAMDIITQVLWDGSSSVTQEVMKSIKKNPDLVEEDSNDDNDFEDDDGDDFEDEEEDNKYKNMKGGLIK